MDGVESTGTKGDGRGMWNSHCGTQCLVGASRGTGDGATHLTEGPHQDCVPEGDETHRRHSHAMELRLHGMGDRGRKSTPTGGSPSSEKDAEGWRVEGVRNFGPIVVSFIITSR